MTTETSHQDSHRHCDQQVKVVLSSSFNNGGTWPKRFLSTCLKFFVFQKFPPPPKKTTIYVFFSLIRVICDIMRLWYRHKSRADYSFKQRRSTSNPWGSILLSRKKMLIPLGQNISNGVRISTRTYKWLVGQKYNSSVRALSSLGSWYQFFLNMTSENNYDFSKPRLQSITLTLHYILLLETSIVLLTMARCCHSQSFASIRRKE